MAAGVSAGVSGTAQRTRPELLDLTVLGIAAGGDGVGRDESGRVIFVPRCAPGDMLRVRIRQKRKTFARAEIERVVTPGPGRVSPACPLFDRCGGCQLQHLADEPQAQARSRIVADALRRIGGLESAVPRALCPGPRLGYRNRVRFHLRRDGDGVRAGYHGAGRPDRIVDADDCPLAEPTIRTAWSALREGWGKAASRLPGGPELEITLRAAVDGRVALHVSGGSADQPGRPDRVMPAIPSLDSYWWTPDSGSRVHLGGHEIFRDVWGGIELELRPDTFVQANRVVAAEIDAWIDAELGDVTGLRMLDLYAGAGLGALRWVGRGAGVTACELNRDAVETGRVAAARLGRVVELVEGRVEAVIDRLLPADVVVVNPPRQGLARSVTDRLAAARSARTIVYASCDPATLARDLRRLAGGWRVRSVQPFDAFPQTAHVETVVVLDRVGEPE